MVSCQWSVVSCFAVQFDRWNSELVELLTDRAAERSIVNGQLSVIDD